MTFSVCCCVVTVSARDKTTAAFRIEDREALSIEPGWAILYACNLSAVVWHALPAGLLGQSWGPITQLSRSAQQKLTQGHMDEEQGIDSRLAVLGKRGHLHTEVAGKVWAAVLSTITACIA